MSEWIRTEDRRPDEGVDVLLCGEQGDMEVGEWDGDGWMTGSEGGVPAFAYPYWRPLPAPPSIEATTAMRVEIVGPRLVQGIEAVDRSNDHIFWSFAISPALSVPIWERGAWLLRAPQWAGDTGVFELVADGKTMYRALIGGADSYAFDAHKEFMLRSIDREIPAQPAKSSGENA